MWLYLQNGDAQSVINIEISTRHIHSVALIGDASLFLPLKFLLNFVLYSNYDHRHMTMDIIGEFT